MIDRNLVERIQKLLNKQKTGSLTEAEKQELSSLKTEMIRIAKKDRESFQSLVNDQLFDLVHVSPESWTYSERQNAIFLNNALKEEFEAQQQSGVEERLKGNPSNPTGEEGKAMIGRMNEEHRELTDWGLDFYHGDPKTILDVGCGGGAAIANLLERYPEATVYGIDISDISIAESLNYNRDAVVEDKVRLNVGDVAELPYGDDFFDLIISVSSYFFWTDFDEAVEQIKRVLKPGATLLLMSMTNKDLKLTSEQEYVRDNLMVNLFDSQEFENIFTKAGFKSVTVHTKEGTHFVCVEAKK